MGPNSMIALVAGEHARELREAARVTAQHQPRRRRLSRRRRSALALAGEPLAVTIRRATPDDDTAVAVLAELDGAERPVGEMLLAEVDGRLQAALPLRGGRPLADPFVPTRELMSLLALRAAQLRLTGTASRA